MKRFLCMMLCAALLCMPALSQAKDYENLLQKMMFQLDLGSGLKGSLVFRAQGSAEWASMLSGISGADVQLRYIRSGNRYQTLLYLTSDEAQHGLTRLDADPNTLQLTSKLLPGRTLTMPLAENMLESLLQAGGKENPTIWSALSALLQLPSERWEAAFAPYSGALEEWLNSYGATAVDSTGETSTVRIRYEIPAAAVREEILTILRRALSDEALLSLLREGMTQEQQAIYLNPNLLYYYEEIIRTLPLNGPVTLERQLSTRGDEISASLSFPLPDAGFGLQRFELRSEAGSKTMTLITAERTVSLTLLDSPDPSARLEGRICIAPADLSEDRRGFSTSFVYTRSKTETVDEQRREHEYYDWALSLTQDLTGVPEADQRFYQTFDPIALNLHIHGYSKNANNSAVTLEVRLDVKLPEGEGSMDARLKTANKWLLLPAEAPGEPLLELPAEELNTLVHTFFANAAGLVNTLPAATSTSLLPAEQED